ncbi:MAG: DUF2283 domain-containing protein [Ardenticatenales bacterium]
MDEKLKLLYDHIGDILYIETVPPYPGQRSEELADEVIARINPTTDAIEGIEVLFFSRRTQRDSALELPVAALLRLSDPG